MEGSGTKLVMVLVGLALAAGGASWFYQYEATRRATEFWGPEAATLIARPSQVEIRRFEPPVTGTDSLWLTSALGAPQDLSKVRGMVHLRRKLIGDTSYSWDELVDPAQVSWQWRLEFAAEKSSAMIVLAEDFSAIGRLDSRQQRVHAASCRPMTESLLQYFTAIGLVNDKQVASKRE